MQIKVFLKNCRHLTSHLKSQKVSEYRVHALVQVPRLSLFFCPPIHSKSTPFLLMASRWRLRLQVVLQWWPQKEGKLVGEKLYFVWLLLWGKTCFSQEFSAEFFLHFWAKMGSLAHPAASEADQTPVSAAVGRLPKGKKGNGGRWKATNRGGTSLSPSTEDIGREDWVSWDPEIGLGSQETIWAI